MSIGLPPSAAARAVGFSLITAAQYTAYGVVGLASTTFMLISTHFVYFQHYVKDDLVAVDTSRIAASVVTGVGFLGGGAILRTGVNVQGFTTASGLWLVAAIGLCGSRDVRDQRRIDRARRRRPDFSSPHRAQGSDKDRVLRPGPGGASDELLTVLESQSGVKRVRVEAVT